MNVTLDEAINIYARAMRSWFGKRAEAEAKHRGVLLSKTGDEDGAKIWDRVATSVRDLKKGMKK